MMFLSRENASMSSFIFKAFRTVEREITDGLPALPVQPLQPRQCQGSRLRFPQRHSCLAT